MKRTPLIAAVVFAVLLAAVIFTREDTVNEGVPKLKLEPLGGEVTQVEVTGAFQAKLTSEGGAWKVNGFAADEAQVKGLTEALKDFHAQDFVTEKTEKHAELEVDDAKGTKVVVSTAAGPKWSLVFGKAAKGGGSYVREAKSSAVFSTNSPVAFHVKKNATAWRKKTITTAPAADVARVTVTQPSGAFTLVNKDATWALEPAPPPGFRFDPGAAQRYVQAATSLQAQDFTDALGEQVASIALGLKDGKTVTLKLGAKKADNTVPLSVEGDPQVYLLPQWSAEQLLKTQEDLRDTTLLAFEPDQVEKLTLTASGKSTVVAKSGGAWKVLEPKSLPAGFEFDPASVPGQLMRLKNLRAAKAVTSVADGAAGFGKPTASVELQLTGGKKQSLKFGGETPSKELYVKGSADALTYAIGAHERQAFEQGVELFKKRPPPDMSQMRGLEQLPPEVRKQLEAQLRQRNN
ncbi:MAG: DUF4340 domain-containing protein [Archangiaceae bacterium]|nr:DUF4340 domain-containing protein [Archangiaceae bacterium]